MIAVKELEFLTKHSFRGFVKKIMKNETVIPDDVMEKFKLGEYDHDGNYGKIIINDDIVYKMNPSTGSNNITDTEVYLGEYYRQVFIAYIVRYIFECKIPDINESYSKIMGTYVKEGKGYSLYELSNQRDMCRYITECRNFSHIDTVLVQSIYAMSDIINRLEEYNFSHNDLRCSNVLVHIDPEFGITYRINDFDQSYIEFNGLKIGSNKPIFEIDTEDPDFEEIDSSHYIVKPFFHVSEEMSGMYFREKRSKNISVDIYVFILSLAFHNKVINNLEELPLFSRMMNTIFTFDDLEKIMGETPVDDDITKFIINNKIRLLFDVDTKIKDFYSRNM